MTIELLKREKGSKTKIKTGITFASFTEAMDYCIDYTEKHFRPMANIIVYPFKILDSNELISVTIGWDKDNEAYSQIEFYGLEEKI